MSATVINPKRKVRITAKHPVACWEEKIVIPVQGPTQNNPLAHFKGTYHAPDRLANYPYSLFHLPFTRHRQPVKRQWRVIFLENAYLRIMICPELGGRIYSMIDKTTDKECFHCNPIVQYMHGGFGGLYSSGGNEIDYPQAHAMTNCRDREATITNNDDGSCTVYISEVELCHRTQWFFSYTLEPDASYVKEEFRAFNRHFLSMPFHFWNNAGVLTEKGSVFLYSEKGGLQHGGATIFTWPIFYDFDLSRFEDIPSPLGIYMYNINEGLVGHYNEVNRHGVARWGAPEGPTGKKIWVWGMDTIEGRAKQVSISGDNTQYCEIQSGYIENQDHFETMTPLEEVRFDEYWFPVKDIGQFQLSSACGALAINLSQSGGSPTARVGFMAARRFKGDKITILLADAKVCSQTLNLAPGECIMRDIPLKKASDLDCVRVRLTRAGKEVVNFCLSDETTPALLTQYEQHGGEYKAVETKGNTDVLLNRGKWSEKMNTPLQAEVFYRKALDIDPKHSSANLQLGVLHYRRGLYKDAHACFDKAAQRDPYNGEIYYAIAINALAQKDRVLAKRSARQAVRSRAALGGNYLLGIIALTENDAETAFQYLKKAKALNMNSTRTGAYLAVALRRQGQKDEALEEIHRILKIDPTDHLAQWELGILGDDAAKTRLTSQIGHLHQPYIELACDYMAIGEYSQVVTVLRTAVKTISQKRPLAMVYYYLGYALDMTGKTAQAKTAFARGTKSRQEFVFPFRDESFDVLNKAIEYNPKDSTAHTCLGMLLYHRRRFDQGYKMFARAVLLNPRNWMAQRNMGLYWFRVKNQPRKAEPFYDKMLGNAPENYFILQEYGQMLAAGKRHAKLIRCHQDRWNMVRCNSGLAGQLVTSLIATGKFRKAVDITRKVQCGQNVECFGGSFANGPGFMALKACGDDLMKRRRYDEAIEMFAETLIEHYNFQHGPFNGRHFAEARYKIGLCHKNLGESKKAETFFRQAVTENSRITWGNSDEIYIWANRYYQALAMKELGMEAQGNIALDAVIDYVRLRQVSGVEVLPALLTAAEEAKSTHHRVIETTLGGVDAEI